MTDGDGSCFNSEMFPLGHVGGGGGGTEHGWVRIYSNVHFFWPRFYTFVKSKDDAARLFGGGNTEHEH